MYPWLAKPVLKFKEAVRLFLVPLLAEDAKLTMRVDAFETRGLICDSATCTHACSQQPYEAHTINKNTDKS